VIAIRGDGRVDTFSCPTSVPAPRDAPVLRVAPCDGGRGDSLGFSAATREVTASYERIPSNPPLPDPSPFRLPFGERLLSGSASPLARPRRQIPPPRLNRQISGKSGANTKDLGFVSHRCPSYLAASLSIAIRAAEFPDVGDSKPRQPPNRGSASRVRIPGSILTTNSLVLKGYAPGPHHRDVPSPPSPLWPRPSPLSSPLGRDCGNAQATPRNANRRISFEHETSGNDLSLHIFVLLTLDRGYRVTRVDRNPSLVNHPPAGVLAPLPPLCATFSPRRGRSSQALSSDP
jgi:hypothetical protein